MLPRGNDVGDDGQGTPARIRVRHRQVLSPAPLCFTDVDRHMVESKGLRFAVSARIIEKSSRGPPVRSRQPEPTNSAASSATPVAAAMSPRRTDPVQPVAGPSRLRQASSSPAEQRQNRRLATNGPHPGLRTTVWVGGLPRGEGAFDARVDLNNIFSSAGNIVSVTTLLRYVPTHPLGLIRILVLSYRLT